MINLSFAKSVASASFGRGTLLLQKYAPEILLGAGVAGSVASTVLACKATLKAPEIIKQMEEMKIVIELTRETAPLDVYSQEEYKKDKVLVAVQGGVNLVRLYAPAIGLGVLSIGAMIGSHYILNSRFVGVLGAYKVLDEAFAKYRKRVVDSLGVDEDSYFRFGYPEKKFSVKESNKKGEKEIKVQTPKSETPPCELIGEESVYAKFFDESSVQFRHDNTMNLFFLKAQQNYANDLLKSRGHVFLNEVYDMLGLPRTKAGSVVGWVLGHGDDFIDFNIYNPVNGDFVNGYEKDSILLDFNVDGVIFDII